LNVASTYRWRAWFGTGTAATPRRLAARAAPALVLLGVLAGGRVVRAADPAQAATSDVEAPAPPTGPSSVPSDAFSPSWEYRRFGGWDLAIAATGGSVVLASALLGSPEEARWRGGILWDDAVRRALRAQSRAGRDTARHVGDAFYYGGALLPTVLDGLVVTFARGAPDVAAQMLAINLEAYAVAGALSFITESAFARARPSAGPCSTDPKYEAFCDASDKTNSFISGHTAIVATSAGLLCAHHQYLHLYGEPWADWAACGLGVGAALTTGVARLINDRHYASDVFTALSVGALSGYVLPVLRHYRDGGEGSPRQDWALVPVLSPVSVGVQWVQAL
jgi:membrane-associated phospholipid phosphatase